MSIYTKIVNVDLPGRPGEAALRRVLPKNRFIDLIRYRKSGVWAVGLFMGSGRHFRFQWMNRLSRVYLIDGLRFERFI